MYLDHCHVYTFQWYNGLKPIIDKTLKLNWGKKRLVCDVYKYRVHKGGCCNRCLSPLMLWVRILLRARCTTLCDKVCQWLVAGTPVSSNNKTDRHDITETLLKVALNTIKKPMYTKYWKAINIKRCRTQHFQRLARKDMNPSVL